MHKKIIFSLLLITNTATHGMEIQESTISFEKALCNPDNAWHITKHLCMNYSPYSHNSQNLRNDIRALYETNKFFHNYYDQEKIKQNIVITCEPLYHSTGNSYRNVIGTLCCHTLAKKIKHFCGIANNKKIQFTENDLKDPWYFKIPLGHDRESLLYLLIQNLEFEKADAIITHSEKLNFGSGVNNYVLKLISENRQKTDEKTCEELLRITERLLREKNMPADGTSLPLTALMDASQNNDQPFARLLLQFGANPYKRRGNSSWEKNSFEMEKGEPKGWLKQMVKTIKFFKYWSVKSYTSDGYNTLPQELLHIIFRTIQQLYFHYDLDKNLLNEIVHKRYTIRKKECERAADEFFRKNRVKCEDGYGYTSTCFKPDINNILKDHTEYHNLFAKAQRLLQKGFRPNFRKNNRERIPLMYAVKCDDTEMIQLLVDFDSNPYLETYDTSTKTMMNAFDFTKNDHIKKMLVKNDF